MPHDWLLRNGRVIDPAGGFDRIADLAIRDGKISSLGKAINPADCRRVEDLSGLIVTPGLIDIHLHAYGSLGFLNPDTIGVLAGVTTMVDAGSAGPYNFPEVEVLLEGIETDWFCFLLLYPLGVTLGLEGNAGDHHRFARSISGIPLARMMDWVGEGSRVRGLKVGAYGTIGIKPIHLAKAVARLLEIPLYIHIGDFLFRPRASITGQMLQLLEAGDMATHIYTPVFGGPLTESGAAAQELKEAQGRGVILDIGFGSFNFSFAMAREGFDRGILPDTISSDLQNQNITGPARSLCHVMSIFWNLGMSLPEVLDRVTARAAKAIGGEWWRGRIVEGGRADLTVLRPEEGEFRFRDCDGKEIKGNRRLTPLRVWKEGRLTECRPEQGEELENWLVEKNDGAPPEPFRLQEGDAVFLQRLKERLEKGPWEMVRIHESSERAVEEAGIELRRAIRLVQKLCLKRPFPRTTAMMLNDLGKERACAYIDQWLTKKTSEQ